MTPVMTSEMSTQTVGLYYPSATKVRMLESMLKEKGRADSKGWFDQKVPLLSAVSPGRGYWRKQIDHICSHLKAHTTNEINFRSLVAQPRMGKLLQATVNEDGYELSLTLNFALRNFDSVVEVKNINGEITKKGEPQFRDLFEENDDDDDEDEDGSEFDRGGRYREDVPRNFGKRQQPLHHSSRLKGGRGVSGGSLSSLDKVLIKEVGRFGKGRADKVQELIDEGAEPKACNNREGLTLLHMASTCNHYTCLPVLVQAGISANATDTAGNTALHEAVKINEPNSEKTIECLLGCGANPNKKNKFSESAFDIAVRLGHQNLTDKMSAYVGQVSLGKIARPRRVLED